jgi:16S rRNA (guanine527-N7)-methyltransferase
MTPPAQLAAGIAALGLSLPEDAQAKLLAYLDLLQKWGRVYNLTAIVDKTEMVRQHLLDSLSVLPYLPDATSLADVGSGAGLPGIPLAIARPAMALTLIDAVQKKSAFQQQAKIELGLANVTVHCGRAETLSDGTYAIVISRAFASLSDFVRVAAHLCAPVGRLYAMKGQLPADEIAALPADWRVAERHALVVPGLAAQRHLIVLERH